MGLDAGTPPGLWEQIRRLINEELTKFARSGFLRNASITDGGLTIKGGFLRLLTKATGGTTMFYIGPTGDVLANGERQQIMSIRRADGTTAIDMYDAYPGSDGTLQQAMTWRDRTGNAVVADDTNSGQGIARPYVPGVFHKVRYEDMTVNTSATEFQTVFRAEMYKQQPKLVASIRASMDTTGATGELRILVNGTPMSYIAPVVFAITPFTFGPEAVAGAHMSKMIIEVQARRTSAGAVRIEPISLYGLQS